MKAVLALIILALATLQASATQEVGKGDAAAADRLNHPTVES